MSTTYHVQTDELSKRFNQIMKIILRYLVVENSEINWIQVFSILQAFLNNAFNNTIDRFFNKMIYDFKIRDVLIVLIQKTIIIDLNFERYRH